MSELAPKPPPGNPDPSPSPHRSIAEAFIDGRSSVARPAVSPDGNHVAFVVGTTDLKANTTRTRVWLDDAPVSAGEHDADPTWSPDGRFLAFTSRRGEKQGDSTLHVMPIDGPGELRTVCTMVDGLGDVAWSPDGLWIAFTSRTRHERYEAKDESWQAPRKIERFFGRLNGEGWIVDRPRHVYVVAADGTGAPTNLTPGDFEHVGVSWLADSSGVVTSAKRHETWDTDFAADLYVVSLPTGFDEEPAVRCLTAHDGTYGSPSVSPDGSLVAFIGSPDPCTHPQNAGVGVLPIDADGAAHAEIRWLTASLDRTFQTSQGSPQPVWESPDHLLAMAEDRGATHLHRIALDASPPRAITDGPVTVTGFSAAAGTVATTRTTVGRPAELFVDDEQRTNIGRRIAGLSLGWEHFTVPTSDGTEEIDAWIMRPAGFDETERYPVLLNVHGGPHTQYGEYFLDEFQMQAAAGFVVVCSNPRGSSGRDEAWGQAIQGPNHQTVPGPGWGTVDVDDVLAVIDASIERYEFCDPARVGMLGGSYGGYMATWLAGHHGERFRAICSERAVNNAVSFEWSSDIATAFSAQHGGTHLQLPDAYERISPIRAVGDIDTPMLIIHSEEDWRCPISQAEELWTTLRLLGKEVDFYRFPGENHELSRSGSPIHRVQRAEIILDWFAAKLAP